MHFRKITILNWTSIIMVYVINKFLKIRLIIIIYKVKHSQNIRIIRIFQYFKIKELIINN